jgi:hypothetical protein
MEQMPLTSVALVMKTGRLAEFFPLLQEGVRISCRVGVTLEDLLVKQLGISPDYLAGRITTIFLDARAVDDVANSLVKSGATIALSGAMPGLVGATMRRGGYYSAMRGAMTHHESDGEISCRTAEVRVKLFNLLLSELGPAFLARGILIGADELLSLLESGDGLKPKLLSSPILDGLPTDSAGLVHAVTTTRGGELLLTVQFEGKP